MISCFFSSVFPQSGKLQNISRRNIIPTYRGLVSIHNDVQHRNCGSSKCSNNQPVIFSCNRTPQPNSIGPSCRHFSTKLTVADVLTIKKEGEDAPLRDVDPPAIMDEIPLYHDFFTNPELYQRIHVHLIGVRAKDPKDSDAGLRAKSLIGQHESMIRHVNASVTVETVGENTGSTDYFEIGKNEFLERPKNSLPIWDAKSVLISRKGSENTSGIKFAVNNGKHTLFECETSDSDFPDSREGWKEFVHSIEDTKTSKGVEFVYRILVTECADKISDKKALSEMLSDTDSVSYTEEIITGATEVENALVQCWRQKKPASKAVLWVLGRNDCFMHPHVAKPLFLDKGYDLYVLNYSSNGMCRKRGWMDSGLLNSHNSYGDFDSYLGQIDETINLMKNYDKVIGYAHSTGGPILINYLMKKSDDFFDGFIFNSPFLEWSKDAVGSELEKFAIENMNIATGVTPMDNDTKLGVPSTPKALKDTPVIHLGDEIMISAWSARIWSQFYFDFRCRPLYGVAMTPGFAKGVNKVHRELLEWKEMKKYPTLKPMVCITSRADDILAASDTLTRIDIVGPARSEIELRHNTHDVFLSHEKSHVNTAVEMTQIWMDNNGFD